MVWDSRQGRTELCSSRQSVRFALGSKSVPPRWWHVVEECRGEGNRCGPFLIIFRIFDVFRHQAGFIECCFRCVVLSVSSWRCAFRLFLEWSWVIYSLRSKKLERLKVKEVFWKHPSCWLKRVPIAVICSVAGRVGMTPNNIDVRAEGEGLASARRGISRVGICSKIWISGIRSLSFCMSRDMSSMPLEKTIEEAARKSWLAGLLWAWNWSRFDSPAQSNLTLCIFQLFMLCDDSC